MTDHTLESQADAIVRLETETGDLKLGIRTLERSLSAARFDLDLALKHQKHLVAIVNAYVALMDDEAIGGTDASIEALTALQPYGLVDIPDAFSRTFTIRYVVGTEYEVDIQARSEEEARDLFEEAYDNDDLDSPEEIEVSHEVTGVREL